MGEYAHPTSSTRAIFHSTRAIFHSTRAILHSTRVIFRSTRAIFHSIGAIFHSIGAISTGFCGFFTIIPHTAQVAGRRADETVSLWRSLDRSTTGGHGVNQTEDDAGALFAKGNVMAAGFLPDTDAALLAWSNNFSTLISAGAVSK